MTDPTLSLAGSTVHRLGYGTMRLVGEGAWGEPKSREHAHTILRTAVASGVDFIDTADAYGPEIAEELIFQALYPYPVELVIATKAASPARGQQKQHPWAGPSTFISVWR
jgi:pyridoxine 4-dehydrogenase